MNRSFAVFQFDKLAASSSSSSSTTTVNDADGAANDVFAKLLEANAPKRKYMRKDMGKPMERPIRVKSALLEYGKHDWLLNSAMAAATASQPSQAASGATSSGKAISKELEEKQAKLEAAASSEEASHLQKLIDQMSSTDPRQVYNYLQRKQRI